MSYKTILAVGALTLTVSAYAQNMGGTDTTQSPSSSQPGQPGMSQGTTNRGTAAESEPSLTSMSPKDVCQKIAEQSSQPAQVDKWLTGQSRKSAEKMTTGTWLKREIGSADCKSETIAGDHAFVVAKSSDNKERLIPFVKQDGMWKLDVPSYRSLYRTDMRMPASENKSENSQY